MLPSRGGARHCRSHKAKGNGTSTHIGNQTHVPRSPNSSLTPAKKVSTSSLLHLRTRVKKPIPIAGKPSRRVSISKTPASFKRRSLAQPPTGTLYIRSVMLVKPAISRYSGHFFGAWRSRESFAQPSVKRQKNSVSFVGGGRC